jgi:predicted nucleic acid-binding protein
MSEQRQGRFAVFSCDIDDLQTIVLLQNRQRLGKGELSSIAFAMKNRQAVLTDDQKAKKLASAAGHDLVQTTPHLFAWLVCKGVLDGKDKETVIAQHTQLDGILKSHLETAYNIAMQYM